MGIIVAFITFSLVLLLSSQHYFTHPSDYSCCTPYPCLHTPITTNHHPQILIASTCSIFFSPILTLHSSLFLATLITLISLPLIHFQLPPDQHTTHHLQIYYKAPLLVLPLLPCHLQRGVHLHRGVRQALWLFNVFKSNECVDLICIGHNGSY